MERMTNYTKQEKREISLNKFKHNTPLELTNEDIENYIVPFNKAWRKQHPIRWHFELIKDAITFEGWLGIIFIILGVIFFLKWII